MLMGADESDISKIKETLQNLMIFIER